MSTLRQWKEEKQGDVRGRETVRSDGRAQHTIKATSSFLRSQLLSAVNNCFPKETGGERAGMRGAPCPLPGGVTAGRSAGPSSCFVSSPSFLLLGASQAWGSGDTNGSLAMFLNNSVPGKSAGLIILAICLMKVSEAW